MKLCWETLDHLVLMPYNRANQHSTKLVYYDDPNNLTGNKGNYDLSEEPCENCGKYFLEKVNAYKKINNFCDGMCKNEFKEKNKKPKGQDDRLRENGGGGHLIGTHPIPWNLGLGIQEGLCYYDTWSERISWFTETRRALIDERVLEVKCCICGSWFSPKHERLKVIYNYVNNSHEKSSWGLYCSNECENKCPYFGKSIDQIIRNDYLNSGKAKYSELHNIPDSILYYDWQEDLKTFLKKERIKQNKVRTKLYRRKRTENEKARIRKKQEKKKLERIKRKEMFINSEEGNKEQRLKRILYLSKQRAKNKNWQHDIDYEWLVEKTKECCPKCNIKFNYDITIFMDPFAPSIDRVDHSKGYTKDNCIITSWMYNCAKNCFNDVILYNICKNYLDFNNII